MIPLATTLAAIRAQHPCESGWRNLLAHLGKTTADDEPLPFEAILDSNGLDDALWCCRAAPQYDREWRLFGVWCARQVQPLMTDPRSVAALDVAERFARGEASVEELASARTAASAAARDAVRDAVRAAAWDAAWAAVRAAARDAVRDAVRAAAGAAVRAAAWDAAEAAARAAQTAEFRRIVRGDAA